MHCDMLKIQDGVAIVEKLNCVNLIERRKFKKYSDRITGKMIKMRPKKV